MDGSVEIGFSRWLSDFFITLYFCPSFSKKHFIVSVPTNKPLPDLIGWNTWNENFPVGKNVIVAPTATKGVVPLSRWKDGKNP